MPYDREKGGCEENIESMLDDTLDEIRQALAEERGCSSCDGDGALFCEECDGNGDIDGVECDWCGGTGDVDCEDCDGDGLISNEGARDEYMEGALDISPVTIKVRVGLSYGGPADGFCFYLDPEDPGYVQYIEYYFQDWFDGATRTLSSSAKGIVEEMFGEYVRSAVENMRR